MPTLLQLSIRELLAIVFFAAIGTSGLFFGGANASVAICAALIATTGLAIVAFVGRGQLRSFAIGYIVPVGVYASLIVAVGGSELDPYSGKLPTTKLFRPAFELVVNREYVDEYSGKVLSDFDPTANTDFGGGGGFGVGTLPVQMRETPDRLAFSSVAHVFLAMFLGYAGAKFAVWINQTQALTSENGE